MIGWTLALLLVGAQAETPLTQAIASRLTDVTNEQADFLASIEENEWANALNHFSTAFDGAPFAKTASGRALLALTHFRSGLPVNGLEQLFEIAEPAAIHPEIRRAWRTAAPATHHAWALAKVKWSPAFADLFGADVEQRIAAVDANARRDLASLRQLYGRLPSASAERGRVGWQLTIASAKAGEVEEAAKILAQLMSLRPSPVSADLMNMTAARLLYQRGRFADAIRYYQNVARASEYWADAQEEAAWAFNRKGEPGNAVATSGAWMMPTVMAGPESALVHAVGQLKLCDYAGVRATLLEFSKRFRGRAERLKELAGDTESALVAKLIERLQKGRVSTPQLGSDASALPRLVSRDERLFEMSRDAGYFAAEARAAERVYGAREEFSGLRARTIARARQALGEAHARVKELALQEAFEIKESLRKLHLVRSEVMEAPAEPWFETLGRYRVDLKRGCKKPKAS